MTKLEAIRKRATENFVHDDIAQRGQDRAFLLRLVEALQEAAKANADYTYSLVMRTDPIRTLAACNKADDAIAALLEEGE